MEIRPTAADEYDAFARALARAFGEPLRQEEIDIHRMVNEPDRTLAAFDGVQMVGTTAALSMSITVPGGAGLPMAAVAAVGVVPTHRRRGILTSLMRRQLDDVRDRGELLAGLWASEGAIYQRFGYGLASFACNLKVERHRSQFFWPQEETGRLRMVEKAEALEAFPPIYERICLSHPGQLGRSPTRWQYLYADPEFWRDGASELFYVLHETDGVPDGYVAYRVKEDWSQGPGGNTLRVRELMAATPQPYAALWRYCFDVDLVATVEAWPRRIDEPLVHIMADPRRLNLRLGDGLWLRLVDVPGALAARRYAAEGDITFVVHDGFCPWNEGTYRLQGGPDGAICERSVGEPDMAVGAADLGATYLGGVAFATLAEAGRAAPITDGAVARADRMFSWEPRPWCSTVF